MLEAKAVTVWEVWISLTELRSYATSAVSWPIRAPWLCRTSSWHWSPIYSRSINLTGGHCFRWHVLNCFVFPKILKALCQLFQGKLLLPVVYLRLILRTTLVVDPTITELRGRKVMMFWQVLLATENPNRARKRRPTGTQNRCFFLGGCIRWILQPEA